MMKNLHPSGIGILATLLLLLGVVPASAQDLCPSADPSTWPSRRVPYVLVVADTSTSMATSVGTTDSCGYGNDRRSHQRCALDRTFKAFAGLVDFGLMSFATQQANCAGACFGSCTYSSYPSNSGGAGCGPEPDPSAPNSSSRAGAVVVVPFRGSGSPPTANGNFPALRAYADNVCTNQQELFASGLSPLNGALRDAFRYLSFQWTAPDGSVTHATPITTTANGELACRPLRVILLTDGDETCDTSADAVDAAADLLAGFTSNGNTWSVRTHVVGLAGTTAALDQIASAGGTGATVVASNDTTMASALAGILHPLVAPEVADNLDNNCNGCVDEGYPKYANVGQACCAWANVGQRATCLTVYQASITPANPQGNRSLLPCTSAAQQLNPATWLTYNPGETCDNVDNNGVDGVDEGTVKCGIPAQCPSTEICDGRDNDCDAQVDEGGVCSSCVPTAEVCDGCDNDCDSVADDGLVPFACGQASPPNCGGTQSCRPQQIVPTPGACVAGGGFLACANNPQTETCDGLDNDCNGIPDDNVAPVACLPAGTPGGLVFGGTSQCRRGQLACGDTVCRGFVGPTPEVSDGIDNDCDGLVEEGIDVMFRNGFE